MRDPIDHDKPPTEHFTYSDGVARSAINGSHFRKLRAENQRRHDAASKHWPSRFV
jgi:hypothetical protein